MVFLDGVCGWRGVCAIFRTLLGWMRVFEKSWASDILEAMQHANPPKTDLDPLLVRHVYAYA